MATNYTWKITGLKTANVEGFADAVVQTYWEKKGIDEDGVEGTFSGATPFTPDPTDASGPFIPFQELTEEDVLSWIKSVVVSEYEKHVNDQIEKQIQSKKMVVKDVTLPWVANA